MRWARLVVAILVFLASLYLLWHLTSALKLQYAIMGGRWPPHILKNEDYVSTGVFWEQQVDQADLSLLSRFFAGSTDHGILLHLCVLVSLVGWSASVFYRIIQAEEDPRISLASWPYFTAALFLAAIAGGIIFLIVVAGANIHDSESAFLPWGVPFVSALSSIAAGLFLTLFFQWFKGLAETIWGLLAKLLTKGRG